MDYQEQYKQTLKITRKDGEKHGIKLLTFDILDLEEFENQSCRHTYKQRRERLTRLDNDIQMKYVEVLPVLYSGTDTSQIMTLLNEVRARNEEGIMLNINDAKYEFKRTKNLLKVKVMNDADLLVTGVYEGTGRNKGKLGGIEVEFINEGKHYRCNCGSGFSDEERVRYFNNPDLIINKICTIQYFEITENDKDGVGIRFPVWTGRIRNDKSEISMN